MISSFKKSFDWAHTDSYFPHLQPRQIVNRWMQHLRGVEYSQSQIPRGLTPNTYFVG